MLPQLRQNFTASDKKNHGFDLSRPIKPSIIIHIIKAYIFMLIRAKLTNLQKMNMAQNLNTQHAVVI